MITSILNIVLTDGREEKLSQNKHYDEEYPPEDQTPKKRKPWNRINSKSGMTLVLPKISKKNSLKPRKLICNEWEGSDDEEYIKANQRVAFHKGYSAANYLIKKYINKVKYCFDKLGVLSSENYEKEISLSK